MIELKVKIVKKYKVWLKGIKPFLDKLNAEGYRWKVAKIFYFLKGINIHGSDGSYIGTIAYDDWSNDSYYWNGGMHYSRYMNYEASAKKRVMYRVCIWLHKDGSSSENEERKFENLIKVLDATREWRPDFEYQFEL